MRELVTVLVADDHPLLRDAVERTVRQDPSLQLVRAVRDGREALASIRALRPAVVVLAADLPGPDVVRGLERDGVAGTRVIVLAERCTPCRGYEMLADGVHGCLDTRTTPDELRRAIVATARGQTYLGSSIQAAVAAEIRLREGAERPFLRPRELEVLELIARGESLTGIAAELHLAHTTVKTHAANLYGKLGVRDRAAAVAEAMRRRLIE